MIPRIAIVGSGPSGFFAADALLNSQIKLDVHMFDRLPTPFGLVRSGVAPDHASIKSVSRVFEKIARHDRFEFFGNVEIGRDVSLDHLRRSYSAVLLAHGAATDARLGIPGENLPQVHAAASFVGWYNGHPDFAELCPDLSGKTAAIFGHGNVAIDIARILLSSQEKLRKTDIAEHALHALQQSKIQVVHLIGRRGPLQASFTTAELRELLLKMDEVDATLDPAALELNDEDHDELSRPANAVIRRNLEVMLEVLAKPPSPEPRKRLFLSFCQSPVAIQGHTKVEVVSVTRNALVATPLGKQAIPTSDRFEIPADLIVTSIGFRGRPLEGAPFDHALGRIPNQKGRVDSGDTTLAPLYVAGWIKRGANGVIGSNRTDAFETVACMLEDQAQNKWASSDVHWRSAWRPPVTSTSFADWKLIDRAEIEAGISIARPRLKFVSVASMLDTLKRRSDDCLPAREAPQAL